MRVFEAGVELKPEPRIVTVVPTNPVVGANVEIVGGAGFSRAMDNRLPTAS